MRAPMNSDNAANAIKTMIRMMSSPFDNLMNLASKDCCELASGQLSIAYEDQPLPLLSKFTRTLRRFHLLCRAL